ncbi:MAG: transcription antitermination factor NusB [Candidatus Giovannonibacteria bacterium]|nr:MAG: transcription antitermination factor NusB [Candidatus Giovannonibacteria bacterium]
MANRHLSRSIAMQSLFEWDFNEGQKDIKALLERDLKEFGPGLDDGGFAKKLAEGVVKKQKEIDGIIEKAAPDWPISQIAPVDRNVLRVGIYELLFGNHKEVPPKVAINEAIELAKSFGGDSSGRFVNGVLGTIYRELGEPGKNDTSQKQKYELDLEKLPKEDLVGAVVVRRDKNQIFFALVHDVFGYWTFSKGHLEKNEELEKGAMRKVKEEMGVKNLDIIKKIGENEYIASDPETGPTRRRVNYFLAETKERELKLASSGGLDDARWFTLEEVRGLKMYSDIKPILDAALKELNLKL